MDHAHAIQRRTMEMGGDPSAVEAGSPGNAIAVGRLRGIDVLLVEDDATSREALELILAYYGATVHCSDSVQGALRAYDRKPPSILVSDIGLPDQDGCALMRTLRFRERSSGRRTPAIALSGFPSRETSHRARQAGFDVFMCKPVELDRLLRVIADLATPP